MNKEHEIELENFIFRNPFSQDKKVGGVGIVINSIK